MKVAFILGDGYSGSTLLDLLLGSHSRMTGVGEVDAEAFDAFLNEDQLCTCLFRASECHFWKGVLDRLRAPDGGEEFRLGASRLSPEEITQNTLRLFRAVAEASSAEVIVDSSKRLRRTQLLAAAGGFSPKVIHLLRDGRGVAYSYAKRGGEFRESLLNWKNTNIDIRNWLDGEGAPERLAVRYEDLCARPAEVVRSVCDFVGVGWEPQMMRVGRKVHHNVRGNEMRFKSKNTLIKLDETWKEHLGADELNLFEELIEPFRQQLGYC
ncbi:MAG TPA: sulfotransferase [Pyrinomonadaceae bacterium]|jgi:hypothetical protein